MPTINQLPSIDEVSGGNQIPTYYAGGGDARKMSVSLLQDYLQDNLTIPDNASEIPYNPAGTGAVARTVEAKLRDVVSVKDFGADPTGVADSYSAFSQALASSSMVFVPSGNYRIGNTLTIPDGRRIFGAGKYSTTLTFYPGADKDGLVIGWYTTVENMKLRSEAPGGGSKGTIRLQSLTNAEIPTNVGGNNWTDPSIGGLSYKNTLRDLVVENGQNYNIYGVNLAYITIENVRAVLARGAAGNVYIWGKGGTNMPISTTVKIIGGEFTASYAGPGIAMENTGQSVLVGAVSEGNYGRGMLITGGREIKIESCYFENNFALSAPTGDGDIVVVNSTRVHISDSYILGNNSSNAVAASGNASCSMKSTGYYVLGGGTHTLSLDSGWYFAASAFGIYDAGTQAGGRWVRYVDGTAVFTKTVSWTGDINTSNGSIYLDPAGVADTDFPNIFMSDGASGYEMQAAIHVMGDSSNFIWALSSGSSKTNNAIRYRLASPTSKTGIAVDVQITLTGRWK